MAVLKPFQKRFHRMPLLAAITWCYFHFWWALGKNPGCLRPPVTRFFMLFLNTLNLAADFPVCSFDSQLLGLIWTKFSAKAPSHGCSIARLTRTTCFGTFSSNMASTQAIPFLFCSFCLREKGHCLDKLSNLEARSPLFIEDHFACAFHVQRQPLPHCFCLLGKSLQLASLAAHTLLAL